MFACLRIHSFSNGIEIIRGQQIMFRIFIWGFSSLLFWIFGCVVLELLLTWHTFPFVWSTFAPHEYESRFHAIKLKWQKVEFNLKVSCGGAQFDDSAGSKQGCTVPEWKIHTISELTTVINGKTTSSSLFWFSCWFSGNIVASQIVLNCLMKRFIMTNSKSSCCWVSVLFLSLHYSTLDMLWKYVDLVQWLRDVAHSTRLNSNVKKPLQKRRRICTSWVLNISHFSLLNDSEDFTLNRD